MSAKYEVELWGSHKDLQNDDCWIGSDHGTLEGAMTELNRLKVLKPNWAYACIEGPEGRVHEETNPHHKPDTDDSDDRDEYARMMGMEFGVGGYNEAMGYDLDEPEDDGYGRCRM